jgi:poly-gamma-glutamate capsule biosynthesis protein CapA/YwtB (metallophosphatase superfamily)
MRTPLVLAALALLVALTAAAPTAPAATVVWGGDVHLGRGIAEGMGRAGHADPFDQIKPYLAQADLRVANLEGQLTTAPQRSFGYYLTGDPARVDLLKAAGLDLVSLANNHATDNGRAGLAESARVVRDAGIQTVGGGLNRPEAYGPALLNVNGIRLGVLAYNFIPPALAATATEAGTANYDEATAVAAVKALRPQADVLVVVPHWGIEYQPRPSRSQQAVARQLVAAGADAVIGAHPHVVQSLEWLPRAGKRPALVAYSLGNFVFDSYDPDAKRGMLLWTRLAPDGIAGIRVLPFKTDWLGVEPRPGAKDQAALVARLMPDAAGRQTARLTDETPWFVPPAAAPTR